MRIDSTVYNGVCPACGEQHTMVTALCIVESGCMKEANRYIREAGLSGFSVAVYDENTYRAEGLVRPEADLEVILPAANLHADDHGVDLLLERLPEKCDYLIAVGSGTIHDITRYCAYTRGIPFVSCPTAASVDGFCSSVAAMTWHGFKKTLTAVAPTIVVADLDVIAKAPLFLGRSGYGDMVGKFVSLAEWRIGHILTGELFCSRIYGLTEQACRDVVDCTDALAAGDPDAYEKLMGGLLLSGLAMQLLGNSRPASGAEHHISHLIEMQPEGLDVCSDALHGEKVGVGTLLACREYHRLAALDAPDWHDYPAIPEDKVRAMFGARLADSILTENETDVARGLTADTLREKWDEVRAVIRAIPSDEELLRRYRTLGVKQSLSDIDVPEDRLPMLLDYSPMVRNRLTLMRVRRALYA